MARKSEAVVEGTDGVTVTAEAKTLRRVPTVEELTDSQKEIYSILPEGMREKFLSNLPPVVTRVDALKHKREAIAKRLCELDTVEVGVRAYREKLQHAERTLDGGDVNLVKVLGSPSGDGWSLRFERGPQKNRKTKAAEPVTA
jgi:hypothetical protein